MSNQPMSDDDEIDALINGVDSEPDESATLTLTTTKKPEPKLGIRIDGVFYQYDNPLNWSLRQRNEFRKLYERLQKFEALKDPSQEQEDAYGRVSIGLIQKCVPDLPADVLEYLSIGKRQAIVMDFFLRTSKESGLLSMMNSIIGAR